MNEQLQSVLRVLKSRDIFVSTSQAELGRLSGLSRKTIIKNFEDIQAYVEVAPEPSGTDIKSFDKKMISTYIDEGIKQVRAEGGEFAFSGILGAITGYVLRHETDLINDVNQVRKVVKVGTAVIMLIVQIQARKDNAGTPIHSKNKYAQYLLTQLNKVSFIDLLFNRTNAYSTGNDRLAAYAKKWSLTPLTEEITAKMVSKVIPIIKEAAIGEGVTVNTTHIEAPICSEESVTQEYNPELSSVDIEVDHLVNLSVPSIIQLVNLAAPSSKCGCISVSLMNLSSADPSLGRTYNVFTSLRSEERKELGFNNYDISGGIQIISFGILYRYASSLYRTADDLFSEYPMIFRYGWEPDYKAQLRAKISEGLGVPVDEVKALLTAYANGSHRSVDGSSELEQFKAESDSLRREVTALIYRNERPILDAAIRQSKHRFPEGMDWSSLSPEEPEMARMKSSVYFFIWTYFEKQIRDAMLSVVDDGIPLHDAIYSRHQIPFSVFEQAVVEQTGFEVKISH